MFLVPRRYGPVNNKQTDLLSVKIPRCQSSTIKTKALFYDRRNHHNLHASGLIRSKTARAGRKASKNAHPIHQ
jgi:hypothetical protein